MKRWLFIISMVIVLAGCNQEVVEPEYFTIYNSAGLEETELTVENEYLLLHFDCTSTEIKLTDKRSGKTWYSNHPDTLSDAIAIGAIMERLQAQLIISYGEIGGIATEWNNHSLSVLNGNFDWELIDNGIRVRYTIGRVQKEYILPPAMYEERWDIFFEQMDADGRRAVRNYYRAIDIDKLRADDNRSELIEKYPDIVNQRVFELRDGLQPHLLKDLEELFESVGYTMEDFYFDRENVGSDTDDDTPMFNITLEYRLDGPDFVVTVPLEEIEYRREYPLLTVAVLPFFGSGGLSDEGFMLVPDGSGAIINFNNGKHNQAIYINSIYGYDYALKREALVLDNQAYFPVFGISNNNHSFICVLEDGHEGASVTADVSGRVHTFNFVHASFIVRNWDDVDISKAKVNARAFERFELSGSRQQRYIFADRDGYVGMAETYRNYLMKNNPWLSRTDEKELPFALGLVGAIDRRENVMGVAVTRPYPLTTYGQAAEIMESFTQNNINNLRVTMYGWFNGGVIHDAPTKFKLIRQMGGKKGFAYLLDTAERINTDIFFETDFTFIFNTTNFNGFMINRDAAKRLSRDKVILFPYCVCYGERSRGTYGRRYSYHLANQDYTVRAISSFYDNFTNAGASNITLSDFGRSLNSNFDVKKSFSRSDAAAMQQEQMAGLKDKGANLIIRGGFAHAAVHADFILDLPLESLDFNIVDESVPFYPMALRGIIPYTGEPLNLTRDHVHAVLKTVENGAGLQYLFMQATGESIQDTNYTRFFASDINRWRDRTFELYHRINSELGHTVNMFMTGHERVAPQATKTVYEDGTKVIVNYSFDQFEYEGIVIEARDFAVIR